jgi:lipopolysaccharide/colanic/teichoic acid biosynthesis glycosyltransferase
MRTSMKITSLINRLKGTNQKTHTIRNDNLYDQDSGLYLEEHFSNLLCLERKRTERSKKPFLLMLLNIEKLTEMNVNNAIANRIAYMLFSITRDIDIKGWAQSNSVIGVIFTEINNMDDDSLKHKVFDNLHAVLDENQANNVEITCYYFPQKDDKPNPTPNPKEKENNSSSLPFYPDLLKRNCEKKISLTMKRVMDIAGSILALIIFHPVFLIVPLLIKLTSKGPVLFRQERIGQFDKKFMFLKFRTMYVDNDSSIHQEYVKKLICEQKSYAAVKNNGERDKTCIYKIKDDPRITPIGRFLRKMSLDEFPQFINVLKGEMSLVGPRPPIPYELDNYDIWHKRRVLEFKPGITGLWQVKGRSRTTFDEMVRMDLKYAREWSLWLDTKILFQTPKAVLNGNGAY